MREEVEVGRTASMRGKERTAEEEEVAGGYGRGGDGWRRRKWLTAATTKMPTATCGFVCAEGMGEVGTGERC
jgi:hypothetical protein